MDNKKVAKELIKLAKELTAKDLVAGRLASGVESELKKLAKKVQAGEGVDATAYRDYTDGELLALFLKPVLQGFVMSLDDSKGFRRNMKF